MVKSRHIVETISMVMAACQLLGGMIAKYAAGSHGTNLLTSMFGGGRAFDFPKSVYAVEDCLKVPMLARRPWFWTSLVDREQRLISCSDQLE